MKKHILICGPRNVGKSTLIQKLLKAVDAPVSGFYTKRSVNPDNNGTFHVYMYDAKEGLPDEEYLPNGFLISDINPKKNERIPRNDVFDTLGPKLLSGITEGIIVMDEIGFLEKDAHKFIDAMDNALNRNIPVIGAIKDKEGMEHLDRFKSNPNVSLFMITKENRDALYDEVLPVFKKTVEQ